MTSALTQYRMPDTAPVTLLDDVEGQGPRVGDDMTVEVALAVMAGARVEYLTVCDEDDQSTGLITLGRLAVLRDSATYTDRMRLRDVLGGSPASTAPMVSSASPGVRPGRAGECVRLPGVLALSH